MSRYKPLVAIRRAFDGMPLEMEVVLCSEMRPPGAPLVWCRAATRTLHFEPGGVLSGSSTWRAAWETPDAYGRRYLASGFLGRLRLACLDLGQAET